MLNEQLEEFKKTLSVRNKEMFDYETTSIFEPNKGYYIHGTAGIGKTFASLHYAKSFILKYSDQLGVYPQNLIRFVKFHEFIKLARASFGDKEENWQNRKQIETYKEIDTLILDDMGTEKNTDYVNEVVYDLIDYRYENKLTTFITSNFSLEDIKSVYGERISSRIAGMCEVIEIKGQDKRIK